MSESSRAWSWRHAFASSDLPATTKAVLHTLGMFMNELGEGCYPSVADICRYSGLDKKTVLKHLAVAREAGWIGIGQHGYRGQKWKRSEYVARWPSRDLDAPCLPFDDEQEAGSGGATGTEEDPEKGGGATPPPSDAGEVVESRGEGGGIEGSKVVEQLHQDKTSPVTSPDTSPVEKERGREENGPEGLTKRAEALFYATFKHWKRFDVSPKPPMLAAWGKLSWAEMEECAPTVPLFLEQCRKDGVSHPCAVATFIGQAMWKPFIEAARNSGPKAEPVEAKPLGKAWMALRLKALLGGPVATVSTKLTSFEEKLVLDGKANADELRRDKLAQVGYPAVNRLHDQLRFRTVAIVDPTLAELASGFVPVEVGSATWLAWKDLHAARGWPWLPDLGWIKWVYFPADGADGLHAFEQALKGTETGKAA